jgi:hypothetical protein
VGFVFEPFLAEPGAARLLLGFLRGYHERFSNLGAWENQISITMPVIYYEVSLFAEGQYAGSKVTRSGPLSSAAEHGNVKLVKAAWNRIFFDELMLFSIGAHGSQVDAASGAFNKIDEQAPLAGRLWSVC